MMMALGLYVFMLETVPYQELQHQMAWRYPTNNRVGKRPSAQYVGPENDVITLSGVLLPEITGGRLSLLALQTIADLGKAWSLLDGSGTIYGMFVIEGLDQNKSVFFKDGGARRIEFTLKLKRVDDDLGTMLGDLQEQLSIMKDQAATAIGGLLS